MCNNVCCGPEAPGQKMSKKYVCFFFRPFFVLESARGCCESEIFSFGSTKSVHPFPFAATVPWTLSCQICLTGSRTEIWSVKYYLPHRGLGVNTKIIYDQLSQFTSWELPFTSHEKQMKTHHPSWQIESKMVDFPWIGQFSGELPRFSWGTQGISAGCWMMTWCLTEKALLGANWGGPSEFELAQYCFACFLSYPPGKLTMSSGKGPF